MFRICAFLALGVALMSSGCGKAADNAAPSPLPTVREHSQSDSGQIVLEAESASSIESPVVIVEDAQASGGKCIAVSGDAGKPGEEIPGEAPKKYPARWGAAIYKFTVAEAGQYRIWGRKFWDDGCGNSFTFVVNGGLPLEFGGDSTYETWDWAAAPALFDLKAGENTLEVLNREDGVKLDKLIFTRDLDFVPQGKE